MSNDDDLDDGPRRRTINLRIPPEEYERLRVASEAAGLTMTSFVRQLIRREVGMGTMLKG